jgi:hypothetical protein
LQRIHFSGYGIEVTPDHLVHSHWSQFFRRDWKIAIYLSNNDLFRKWNRGICSGNWVQ